MRSTRDEDVDALVVTLRAADAANLAFDICAVALGKFDDFLRAGDVLIERVFRTVKHDGRKAEVECEFDGLHRAAVVKMNGRRHLALLGGRNHHRAEQIER